MRTGKLSEISAEHEVIYTWNEKFWVKRISKATGEEEGLYELVVRESSPKIIQGFSSA